jgi:hypothetical protein
VEAGTDLSLSARRNLTIKSGAALSIQGGMVNVRAPEIGLTATGALNMTGTLTNLTGLTTLQLNSPLTTVKGANFSVAAPTFLCATIPVPAPL